MNWYLFVAALLWFLSAEYIRGRPSCPGTANFVLTYISPIGALTLIVLSILI